MDGKLNEMTVSLSHDDAQRAIQQVDEGLNSARSILQKMRGDQDQMLAASWKGGSAGHYDNLSRQQEEDFGKILADLEQIAAKGKAHINSVTSQDNN